MTLVNQALDKNVLGKYYLAISLSPIIISVIITIAILIFFNSLPEKLPLFYSLSWGDHQLATHQEFLIIPASIIAITLINLIISLQLHPSQVFLKKILLLSPFVINLIFIISLIKIIKIFI